MRTMMKMTKMKMLSILPRARLHQQIPKASQTVMLQSPKMTVPPPLCRMQPSNKHPTPLQGPTPPPYRLLQAQHKLGGEDRSLLSAPDRRGRSRRPSTAGIYRHHRGRGHWHGRSHRPIGSHPQGSIVQWWEKEKELFSDWHFPE